MNRLGQFYKGLVGFIFQPISCWEGLLVLAISVPLAIAAFWLASLTITIPVFEAESWNPLIRQYVVLALWYGPPAVTIFAVFLAVRKISRLFSGHRSKVEKR